MRLNQLRICTLQLHSFGRVLLHVLHLAGIALASLGSLQKQLALAMVIQSFEDSNTRRKENEVGSSSMVWFSDLSRAAIACQV